MNVTLLQVTNMMVAIRTQIVYVLEVTVRRKSKASDVRSKQRNLTVINSHILIKAILWHFAHGPIILTLVRATQPII